MLLIGADRAEILQYATEKYNISERAVDELIAKANAIYAEIAKAERVEEFGKALTRLNNLYARSLKVQDFKTCLSVQKEISNLLGLNAPEKKDITSGGEKLEIVIRNAND
jgi:hypothetical protein